jgi:hypothetical protein
LNEFGCDLFLTNYPESDSSSTNFRSSLNPVPLISAFLKGTKDAEVLLGKKFPSFKSASFSFEAILSV